MTSSLATANTAIADSQKKYRGLEAELAEHKLKNSQLQGEYETLVEDYDSLEKENDENEEKLSDEKIKSEALQEELDKLKKDLNETDDDIDALEQELELKTEQVKLATEALFENNGTIEELKDEKFRYETLSKTRMETIEDLSYKNSKYLTRIGLLMMEIERSYIMTFGDVGQILPGDVSQVSPPKRRTAAKSTLKSEVHAHAEEPKDAHSHEHAHDHGHGDGHGHGKGGHDHTHAVRKVREKKE